MRGFAGEDTIIVHSCAVTNEAVRQTRQAIRRAHRETPGKRIIVTGCAAQLDPQSFAAMPEVTKVIGNADKFRAAAFANENKVVVSAAPARRCRGLPGAGAGFVAVRPAVTIAAIFCSIWQARGASRFAALSGHPRRRARELDAGERSRLTQVDITSYDGGLGPLARSCRQTAAIAPAPLSLDSIRSGGADGAGRHEPRPPHSTSRCRR
jgi:threonylcarbamoyladenosine tRNA methylthiotransferase MtaB